MGAHKCIPWPHKIVQSSPSSLTLLVLLLRPTTPCRLTYAWSPNYHFGAVFFAAKQNLASRIVRSSSFLAVYVDLGA